MLRSLSFFAVLALAYGCKTNQTITHCEGDMPLLDNWKTCVSVKGNYTCELKTKPVDECKEAGYSFKCTNMESQGKTMDVFYGLKKKEDFDSLTDDEKMRIVERTKKDCKDNSGSFKEI